MSRRFSYVGPVDIIQSGHNIFRFEWAEMAEHVDMVDISTWGPSMDVPEQIEGPSEWSGTARTVGNRIPDWLANNLGSFEVLLDDDTIGAIVITSMMYCNSAHSITFTGIGAPPS